MLEEMPDLNLPATVVTRIIKSALPDGINIGKEARCAISRAASVFIVHLTASTAAAARKEKHNSLSSDNVFSALKKIEFENFIEPLRDTLNSFRMDSKMSKFTKTKESKTADTLTMKSTDGDDTKSSMQEQTEAAENEE